MGTRRHKGTLTSERARQIRPPQPAKIHGMASAPDPKAMADAEAKLYEAYPHLDRKREGALVTSLARVIALCETGWRFFAEANLGRRTGRGVVRWNPGLPTLMSLERQKLELMRELKITPRSREAEPEPDDVLTKLRREAGETP